jgi:glycosyltransferase involved in cell wall biosynthesis
MKRTKIKRFYIMPEVWVTVTQSQVFNWIKLINQEDDEISTDCISITNDKNSKKDVKEIESLIEGKFIEIHNFKRLIVSDLYIALVLFKFYLKNIFQYDKIIFQTRLGSTGFTYAILKWLPKTKFIFEARGAKNEERVRTTQGDEHTLKMKIKMFFSETSEKLLLSKSDRIICVSNALKEYHIEKHKLSDDNFFVFPGAADSYLFFYDENLRNETRLELAINTNDILVVYSGRLEMKWEIPDKIFEFFKNLQQKDSRFKLLLITPDVEMANDFKDKYNCEDSVTALQVEFKEVNNYLNASDAGLLLREDIPMNNVASPTKFSEYLMSGLPVIISSGVNDFADIIDQTEFGVVVKGLDEISSKEFEKLNESLKINKIEISEWGVQNLSKEFFLEKYIELLKEI